MKGRILVVDDETHIQTICSRVLKGAGLDVQTASSGEQALDVLSRSSFDAVLSDVNMPGGMNGEALLENIRAKYPKTQVVLMTAFPDISATGPALKNSSCELLIKPFDQKLLLSVVERCLRRGRLEEAISQARGKMDEIAQTMEKLEIAGDVSAFRAPIQELRLAAAKLSELEHEG